MATGITARPIQPSEAVFTTAKRAALGAWNLTVTVLTKSRDAITFLFWGVLNFISPKWAGRVGMLYYWGCAKWQEFWSERKIANLTEENESLKVQNQDLTKQCADAVTKANTLQGEKDDLEVKNSAMTVFKELLEKKCIRLEKANDDSAKDYVAVKRDLDLLREQLSQVQTQNTNLSKQRDSLQQQVNLFFAQRPVMPGLPIQTSGLTVAKNALPEHLQKKLNLLLPGVCV